MISHIVTVFCNALDGVGEFFHPVAYKEEGGFYIFLLEYIQKYGCQIVVLIATVKTDIDIAVIRRNEVSIIMLILFCQLHSVDWTVSAVYIAARSVTV